MAQSYEEYANIVLNVNGKQAKDTMKELEKEAKGMHDLLIQAMKTGDQKEKLKDVLPMRYGRGHENHHLSRTGLYR